VIEVSRANDIEPCGFQRLRNQTCIVSRGVKRPSFIVPITKNQRNPLFRARVARGNSNCECDKETNEWQEVPGEWHDTSSCRPPAQLKPKSPEPFLNMAFSRQRG
jgi:hypothetical protein